MGGLSELREEGRRSEKADFEGDGGRSGDGDEITEAAARRWQRCGSAVNQY